MANPPGYAGPESFGEDGQVDGFDFSEKSIRRAFIRKVYAILFCQLLITMGFISFFLFYEPVQKWVAQNMIVFWVALVVVIVCMIAMACCSTVRRTAPMNFIFLAVFTIAMSFMLGITTSTFSVNEVLIAVGITAGVTLALTLFAFQTKWDFTMMGGALVAASMVLLLFGLMSIFIRNDILSLVYAALGALIFSLYIVYDTQIMIGGKHKYSISPEEYIFAALNLYLDIINLLMFILQIMRALR